MLELEFVVLGQLRCTGEIGWLTFLFKLDFFAERIAQTTLDQIDREVSDVDPDPLPAELWRGVNGCATSAKWIENDMARIARRTDDALKERDGFLCWVT